MVRNPAARAEAERFEPRQTGSAGDAPDRPSRIARTALLILLLQFLVEVHFLLMKHSESFSRESLETFTLSLSDVEERQRSAKRAESDVSST